MRKTVMIILMVILIAPSLIGCNAKSPLKEAVGATATQAREIEEILLDVNIKCNEVSASVNPLISDLVEGWEAYDIVGDDEKKYLLIIQSDNKSFTAALEDNGKLLYGIIDNTIWPSRYPDAKE